MFHKGFVSALLLLMILSGEVAGKSRCSLSHPKDCDDAFWLSLSPGFGPALERFFGNYRGNFIAVGTPAVNQMFSVLGGPAYPREDFQDYSRFTACMPHNCGEKGIVITGPKARIVAAGILHSTCAIERHSPCNTNIVMTVFLRAGIVPIEIINAILDWAKLAIESDNSMRPSFLLKTIVQTDITVLPCHAAN